LARSARLFEIIQILRTASQPQTAKEIAQTLEVTKRTIYRDIVALQAMRVPIVGEAGIGYVMRPGFDLPPINFDIEEAEAITVGLAMIARTGDRDLQKAAQRAARKISEATPLSETLFSSTWGPQAPSNVDLSQIRKAIRDEQKIRIEYHDGENQNSHRTIRPIAIIYYSESVVLVAWCELRKAFRHFRPDRFGDYEILSEKFTGESDRLRQEWSTIQTQKL
jgi:predicted DNA-binding transcriptional regulator YafY